MYIGRPSKWGNPFEIGRDGDRETVIRKYREWILTQPNLMAALPELRGKVLGCWCSPKACHGDVLVSLANAEPIRAGVAPIETTGLSASDAALCSSSFESPTNKNMLGKLLGTAIRVVTLPLDAANAGLEIITGDSGTKRQRTNSATCSPLGDLERLRDRIAETADEIDDR